jgi:hypothetical protein
MNMLATRPPMLASLVAALLLSTTPNLHAQSMSFFSASSDAAPYAAGTRAMDEHRWQDAIAAFDQVINAHGKQSDAAIYWKAYSLNKLGNKGLALATCFQLRSQFASSTWNKDCDALKIDLNAANQQSDVIEAPERAERPERAQRVERAERAERVERVETIPPVKSDPESELKMLAINSLLNQDPARAIPLLRGILSGNQPPELKKRALFVLAQSKSPEAQSILNDAATGKLDPGLQREAIQSMAIFEGKRANDTLVEVYRTTTDPSIKKSVISALFITQDAPRMVELARNEKNLDLKRSIVSQLAIMHDKAATDYMLELLK